MNNGRILKFKHKRIIAAAVILLISFALSLTSLIDGDWAVVKTDNGVKHKGICCSNYGKVVFEHLIATDLYLTCVFELLCIYRLVIIWFQVARDKFEKGLFITYVLQLTATICICIINLASYPKLISKTPRYYNEPKVSLCYWLMIPIMILHLIAIVLLCLAFHSFHSKRSFENLSFKKLLFCLNT
ncbi:unnamed protein product [Auanema sp. JU1783]|nr:unnamed protein product [Auanema sp. JU1783]